MEKVLYFEGAGMDFYGKEQTDQSDVGNFRIRTSFFDNDGIQHYVEVGNGYRPAKNNKSSNEMFLHVNYFFDIGKQLDSPNRKVCKEFDIHYLRTLDYTKENIVKLINDNLNTNFTSMEVLDTFYSYNVHDGKGLYNAMEHIELDHERAKARKVAYENIDMEYRKALNEKYSKIQILGMYDNDIVIRCYASDKALQVAGLERIVTIPVVY